MDAIHIPLLDLTAVTVVEYLSLALVCLLFPPKSDLCTTDARKSCSSHRLCHLHQTGSHPGCFLFSELGFSSWIQTHGCPAESLHCEHAGHICHKVKELIE